MKFAAVFTIIGLLAGFCLIDADTICSNGFKLINNKCWALVRQSKSWSDAEKMCRFTDGAVLVQPQTAQENELLVNFMSGTGIDSVWMGLQCFGNSASDCQWDDGTRPSDWGYSNFRVGATDDGGHYTFNSDTGKWSSSQSDSKRFVCELPPTTKDCNSNCGINYNNFCYKLYDMQRNFDEAESYCRQRNSFLVSLHSGLEERFVSQLYRDEGNYWLGGKIDKSTLQITWLDGTAENISPGKKGYVSGSCMQMNVDNDSYSQGWYGKDCTQLSIFMCKRNAFC